MPTYAENAAERERAARKAAQDRHLDGLHARFDATADEVRMKYERPQFAVVGEGTRSAQDAYREGYKRIFGPTRQEVTPLPGFEERQAVSP